MLFLKFFQDLSFLLPSHKGDSDAGLGINGMLREIELKHSGDFLSLLRLLR